MQSICQAKRSAEHFWVYAIWPLIYKETIAALIWLAVYQRQIDTVESFIQLNTPFSAILVPGGCR